MFLLLQQFYNSVEKRGGEVLTPSFPVLRRESFAAHSTLEDIAVSQEEVSTVFMFESQTELNSPSAVPLNTGGRTGRSFCFQLSCTKEKKDCF